jgi:hypothetical protein
MGAGVQLGAAYLGGPAMTPKKKGGGSVMTNTQLSGTQGIAGGAGGGLVGRKHGGGPHPASTLPHQIMKPWTGGEGTSRGGLSSILEMLAAHSEEMRAIREKYKTTRKNPLLGLLADFLGATGESMGSNIPMAGPLKERLRARKALTQKYGEREMALDLKELESQMEVKKEVMIQQLKNRSKIGKYSPTMLNSMRDTANSLAGTSLIWIDGEWQGTAKKKATPKAMLNFTRILALLENRTAKYMAKGYDELEAVAAAKNDLEAENKIPRKPPPKTQSIRPPPILSTVPVSPINIP